MTSDRIFRTIVVSYIVIAVLTFGYSYNKEYVVETDYNRGINFISAWGYGAFWPLYLSVKLFEGVRP